MEDDPSLFFQAEESGEADYLSLPSTGDAATTARTETASTCHFTALRRPPRPLHTQLRAREELHSTARRAPC